MSETRHRPYRPPIGMPSPKQNRAGSAMASLAFHLLLLLLLIGPIWMQAALDPTMQGAGGPGPSGGGGGGAGGSGGLVKERLRYVMIALPPAATPILQPVVTPPVVKPPEPEKPKPEAPRAPAQPDAARDASKVTGGLTTGGGSGHDGTAGSGPGTGDGVGSGDGTGRGSGRGSGRGPGIGGGDGRIFPPTVTNLAILPIPVPSRVRPYKMIAYFEVDERGNARLLSFNPSKDSDYNKKIRLMLEEVRFKPAVRADGVPVKDTTFISAEAPG